MRNMKKFHIPLPVQCGWVFMSGGVGLEGEHHPVS